MNIAEQPEHIRKAHDLMCAGFTTREMAERLKITLNTAANYRNRVNRVVGFNRPWEKRHLS